MSIDHSAYPSNIYNLEGIWSVGHAITDACLSALNDRFVLPLPDTYIQLLKSADGFSFSNGVIIYSSSDLFERNETLEVAAYAPGFLAIGDDSGGQSILIPFEGQGVFLVDQGSMDPDDFLRIGSSLPDWLTAGCPVD